MTYVNEQVLFTQYAHASSAHAKCFTKGECVLCNEEFYLPTWTDLFFVTIVVVTAVGSIVVHHL